MLLILSSLLEIQQTPPIEPQPGNGPSGGASWLIGYKAQFDYSPKRRRSKRDELLFLRA